jgi:hypothetical protein
MTAPSPRPPGPDPANHSGWAFNSADHRRADDRGADHHGADRRKGEDLLADATKLLGACMLEDLAAAPTEAASAEATPAEVAPTGTAQTRSGAAVPDARWRRLINPPHRHGPPSCDGP